MIDTSSLISKLSEISFPEAALPWVLIIFCILTSLFLFYLAYFSVGIILALALPNKIEIEVETTDGIKSYQLSSSKNPLLYVKTLRALRRGKKVSPKIVNKITKKCPAIVKNGQYGSNSKGSVEDMDISDI